MPSLHAVTLSFAKHLYVCGICTVYSHLAAEAMSCFSECDEKKINLEQLTIALKNQHYFEKRVN